MYPEATGPQSVSSTEPPGELLGMPAVRGSVPHGERADAALNRQKILNAAARLFAVHGIGRVSLDAVARAAGVGKGTLFRRFGDKAGLAVALLDERERALQETMLFGPPPLGPGAPPTERVTAFTRAYLAYLLENRELVLMSETASRGARFRIGAFRFWHRHLAVLCEQSGVKPTQANVLAHALLAPLAAEHVIAQLDAGAEPDVVVEGLVRHAELVAGGLSRP